MDEQRDEPLNERSEQIQPADAARALDEIDRRREQAIRRKIFPRWYWWAHAALIVAFTTTLESGRGVVVAIGIVGYVICALAVDLPVRRAARAAVPHRGLSGPGGARRTLIGLASFVAVLLAVLVTTALSLKAAGVSYAVTIAAAVTAILFAVGGQAMVRWEAAFLVRRSGDRSGSGSRQ